MQPEMRNDATEQDRARRRQQRQEQVQRRRLALGIVALGLIILVIALVIGLSGDGETVSSSTTGSTAEGTIPSGTFSATLTGADSVPPVQTAAAGELVLTWDSDDQKLSFVLEITKKLTNPTVAAIYEGTPGVSGEAVYMLYVAEDPNEGTYQGTLAEATIVEMDLIGPLQDGTIEDLLNLIRAGNAYVSVGNKSHPVDAIRGQIEAD